MRQPTPTPNASRPIWCLVIEDMQARDAVGRERYGVPLQAGNGRDALMDLYEELLDAVVYLRQVIEERNLKPTTSTARGMGSAGGKAAAASMTPQQRKERARKAANSRWGNSLPAKPRKGKPTP